MVVEVEGLQTDGSRIVGYIADRETGRKNTTQCESLRRMDTVKVQAVFW